MRKQEHSSKFTEGPGFRINPTWLGRGGRGGPTEDEIPPNYQPLIVGGSVTSLLIYFCVLREENDVDEELYAKTLYDYIDGLEQFQLELCLEYYADHGLGTKAIRKRLREIDTLEAVEGKKPQLKLKQLSD